MKIISTQMLFLIGLSVSAQENEFSFESGFYSNPSIIKVTPDDKAPINT